MFLRMLFMPAVFLMLCEDIVASSFAPDTTIQYKWWEETEYHPPKDRVFFRANFIITGSMEVEENGLAFIPYHSLPGWPQEYFDQRYSYNKVFDTIRFNYKDIRAIKFRMSHMVVKHIDRNKYHFGTIDKQYRKALYLKIKYGFRRSQGNVEVCQLRSFRNSSRKSLFQFDDKDLNELLCICRSE
jgi:hypothetical protein